MTFWKTLLVLSVCLHMALGVVIAISVAGAWRALVVLMVVICHQNFAGRIAGLIKDLEPKSQPGTPTSV